MTIMKCHSYSSCSLISISITLFLITKVSSRDYGSKCHPNIWIDGKNCTLPSGRNGVCATDCRIPKNQDAEVCCQLKKQILFEVYFCCEETVRKGTNYAVSGKTTQLGEFPYMVALGWFNEGNISTYIYKCGGVVISTRFILTAAHCAYINGIEPNVVLIGGVHLADEHPYHYTIEKIVTHPDYDEEKVYNDIAVIELVGDSDEGRIELWRDRNIVNTSFTAIGYGDTTFGGTSSEELLKVYLEHVSNSTCQLYYEDLNDDFPKGVLESQICAKDPKDEMDTCQGDSGGPLIMTLYENGGETRREFLVGITSLGLSCASKTASIYTRVSSYIEWIESVTGI